MIGDQIANTIIIPQGNTRILSYTLGEGVNGEFVVKPIQYNAPCEYNTYNIVYSRTWITFNAYTASQ